MNRIRILLAVGITATVALLAPAALVSAQEEAETQVQLAHGLNLDGQVTQDEGGTPVTLCLDGLSAAPDLQFGEVIGPVPYPTGTELEVVVLDVEAGDCEVPDPTEVLLSAAVPLDDDFTQLVLTYGGEDDTGSEYGVMFSSFAADCTPAGQGAIGVTNGSGGLPTVDVSVEGFEVDTLEFLNSTRYPDLPAATYEVGVDPLFLGPVEVDLAAQQLVSMILVGGIPIPVDDESPAVAVFIGWSLPTCPPPPTPPAPPTTAPPAPTPEPVTPAPRAAPAERPLSLAG